MGRLQRSLNIERKRHRLQTMITVGAFDRLMKVVSKERTSVSALLCYIIDEFLNEYDQVGLRENGDD